MTYCPTCHCQVSTRCTMSDCPVPERLKITDKMVARFKPYGLILNLTDKAFCAWMSDEEFLDYIFNGDEDDNQKA